MRKVIANACRPMTKLWNQWNPGSRILMYHRVADLGEYDQLTVTPVRFDEQLRQLKSSRRVVGLDGDFNIDENNIVITFDDGYLDNFEVAAPLLQKHELPATIYLTADFVDQKSSHSRYKTASRLHMDWTEVSQLAHTGLITFGSHTCTHPMLSELKGSDARREIVDSKKRLEDKLGTEIFSFAYPNGNYGQREVDYVREAGYKHAVTVKPGVNRGRRDLFQLRRTEITDRDESEALAAKLDGALDPVHLILDMKREWLFKQRRNSSVEPHT